MMFNTKTKKLLAVLTAMLIVVSGMLIPAAMADAIEVWDGSDRPVHYFARSRACLCRKQLCGG